MVNMANEGRGRVGALIAMAVTLIASLLVSLASPASAGTIDNVRAMMNGALCTEQGDQFIAFSAHNMDPVATPTVAFKVEGVDVIAPFVLGPQGSGAAEVFQYVYVPATPQVPYTVVNASIEVNGQVAETLVSGWPDCGRVVVNPSPTPTPSASEVPVGSDDPIVVQNPDRASARVGVKARHHRTTLFVNVGPNLRKGDWTVQVQKRASDGSWHDFGKTRKTHGKREHLWINLHKGTYRVKVVAGHGREGATSNSVSLRA